MSISTITQCQICFHPFLNLIRIPILEAQVVNGTLAVYRLVQMSTKVSVVAPLEAVEEIIEETAEMTREV